MKSNGKHLTKKQRDIIEIKLNNGCMLCDIADVFANGLGALLGVLAGLIIRRFIR